MEVLRLKRVEVTDIWGAEFMAAWWSQGGSADLLRLLAVHFLWHGKSPLQETHRQTERQTHTHTKKDTFKPFEKGFVLFFTSTHFSFLNFCYFANSLILTVFS